MLPLIGLSILLAAVQDLGQGQWKFVPAESTYESAPAPRESRRQWIADGEGVRFLHDGINADGKPFHTEFRAGYDGKPVPFIGGTLYDSVALFYKNPRRVEQIFTLKGKPTVKAIRTISKDGNKMTIDSRGSRADGTRFKNILVYQRLVVN
jgi:hypothetical protein